MAAYPKSPSANLHQGVVNGITRKWADNARGRMAIMHYATMGRGTGPITLKAATEHLSYNCVTRLGKDRARIMYDTIPSMIGSNMLNFFQGFLP